MSTDLTSKSTTVSYLGAIFGQILCSSRSRTVLRGGSGLTRTLCLGPNCVRADATLASEASTALSCSNSQRPQRRLQSRIQSSAVVLVCLGRRCDDSRLMKGDLTAFDRAPTREAKIAMHTKHGKGSLLCGEPLGENPLHATSILWIERPPMTQVLWNVARSLDLLLGR